VSARRSHTAPQLPPRLPEATLPGGRTVPVGAELSITGERGRFVLRWVEANGDLTCWGGPDGHAAWRTFRPARVRTVHRKLRPQRGAQ
jgi:hypothetical protein